MTATENVYNQYIRTKDVPTEV